MLPEQERYFLPLHVFADLVCTIIAFCICAPFSVYYASRCGATVAALDLSALLHGDIPLYWKRYLTLIPLLTILPLLFLSITRSYTTIGIQRFSRILRSLLPGFFLTCVFFVASISINPQPLERKLFITLCTIATWLLFIINRICISWYILHSRESINFTRFFLIIGTDSQAVRTADLCGIHPEWGITIIGFLSPDTEEVGRQISCHRIIGHTNDLPQILSDHVVDCVLLAGGINDFAQVHSLALRCEAEGVDFGLAASLISDKVVSISTERLVGIPSFFFKAVAQNPSKLFIKRLIDVTLSLVFVILLLPLWVILPIIIKRDSPGPALYFHERVGRHGRRFTMYKFRTMVVGADTMQDRVMHLNEMDGPVFKIQDDPRFTGIGRFLRTTSIDELPQLFNVLKGDMSLVGPRPPIIKEVLQYQPWQKKRLSVIPGITCLWQVTGRNEIKFEEWMQLDLQYIENWSLSLDLKILLRTVVAVLARKGAS